MYAVVAPGYSCVCTNYKEVERVAKLYPYPKWRSLPTEELCLEWIKKNRVKDTVDYIYNYGDSFENIMLSAEYRIIPNEAVAFKIDYSKLGDVRFEHQGMHVKYTGKEACIYVENVCLSPDSIAGHLSAIHILLEIVGPWVDINITLPNYSIMYAINHYEGTKFKYSGILRKMIADRCGKVSYTLNLINGGK